jgi:hypothetical protein
LKVNDVRISKRIAGGLRKKQEEREAAGKNIRKQEQQADRHKNKTK